MNLVSLTDDEQPVSGIQDLEWTREEHSVVPARNAHDLDAVCRGISSSANALPTLDRGACRSVVDVGLQLAVAKRILGRLQEIVVSEQLQRHCEAVRPCAGCHRRRHLSPCT